MKITMTGPHLLAAVAYDEYYNDVTSDDGRLRQAPASEFQEACRGRMQAYPDRRAVLHSIERRGGCAAVEIINMTIEGLPEDVHVRAHLPGQLRGGSGLRRADRTSLFRCWALQGDLVCQIECDAYLIEHDMTPHYEGLLGNKQLGVGAVDVQAPNVETGEQVAERIKGALMAAARADHHHEFLRVQSSAAAYRARQASRHDRSKSDTVREIEIA